jgi:PAS domain S-box-containing protein
LYAPSEHNPRTQELELIERAVHLAGIAIEQKRAEKELKDSERMLRLLAGNAEEVILAYDMNRRLIYVNPAIEKQTGYSMDEMRSRHFIKWVHRDDDAHMMELWEKLYQGEGYSGIEFRIVTKDGQIRWIHGSWGPLRDENGKQIGVQGREIDITDRKLAEERLRDNEMLLARAQSLAHLGSWQKDLITGELLWSDEIYRIFGLPLGAKLTSRTFYDLLHPADVAAVRTAFDEAIRNGTNYAMDHRIIRPDGSERYVHEQAEILHERGIPVRMIGTIQDITDRRQLEERLRQSQKMEAIGQLAGGVAHDFNNLLTGILGHCDLLLGRRRDNDPLRQEIEEIRRAGDRAASLTRQLLAFSRKQVLQPRVLDVRQLVANMSKMLRRLISEDIQLVTVSCPDLWHVRADPGQMEQVILNLVLNARDAMPLGGTLTIGIANLELSQSAGEELGFGAGQYVELEVSDTGQGMDTATLSRIFEPFFTTKQHGKGTGLGLSTVYGIVKQSGGHVRVSSKPGEGTTLRVYLPRVEEDTDDTPTEEEPADVVVLTGTVLLVEDEDVVRRLVRDILEHHGFRVLEARHAEEALHMAAAPGRTITLLLTDVILPQMSGRELADRLLATLPDLKVLYMSGYTDDAILEHGLVDRGRPFLQKPFTPDLLMRKIRDVLQDA